MSMANPEPEVNEPPRGHVRVIYLGPVAPHWEVHSDFGDRAVIDEFRARVMARLELLPPHDPQFRRNRERVVRDAEREHLILAWDLGPPADEEAAKATKGRRYSLSVPYPIDARLLNRELSWLDFNARVLALAERDDVPLLERAKFLAIYSQNTDEFFQVRVAGLKDQVAAGIVAPTPDGRTPAQQLLEIQDRVEEQTRQG